MDKTNPAAWFISWGKDNSLADITKKGQLALINKEALRLMISMWTLWVGRAK